MARSNKTIQYLVTLAVSLAGLTVGVSIAWTTVVIPKFHNDEVDFKISQKDMSWVAATSSIGIMVGSLMSSFVSDRYGRRATLMGSFFPFIIGTVVLIVTSNVWLICLAQFLWGIGIGKIVTVSNIYIAEIAHKDIRGSVFVINRIMTNFGNFLMLAIGPFISYNAINYMLFGLPIVYLISCYLSPETPYFYLKEGKVDDARKSLIRLTGTLQEKVLEDELSRMRSSVNKEMRRSGTVKELFTGKQYRKAIIVATGLRMGQIFSGSVVIPHYLGTITQESNTKLSLPTIFIVFGVLRLVVGVVSSMIADKVGRRPLLLYSFLGSSICLAIIAAYFYVQEIVNIDKNVLSSYAIIVFIFLFLNSTIMTLGYNALASPVAAELFPMNVKSIALSFNNIFAGFISFLVIKTYQPLKDSSGLFGVFSVFTISTVMAIVFVYFIVPETKGKSLEEIQIALQGIYYDHSDDKVEVMTKDVPLQSVEYSTELKPMIDQKNNEHE